MNIKLRASLKASNTAIDITTLKYASTQTALTTQELILSYPILTYHILTYLIAQQDLQKSLALAHLLPKRSAIYTRHHTRLPEKTS